MSDSVLIAEAGRTTGSAESRRIRREDRIPAVVYGQGMEPISLSVNRRDLRLALSGAAGMNTILELTQPETSSDAALTRKQNATRTADVGYRLVHPTSAWRQERIF